MAFGRCRKCRGGTPAGERARSGRAAQAAFSVARPVRRLRTGRGLRVCRRSASFFLFAGSEFRIEFRSPDERSEIREWHKSLRSYPHIAPLIRATGVRAGAKFGRLKSLHFSMDRRIKSGGDEEWCVARLSTSPRRAGRGRASVASEGEGASPRILSAAMPRPAERPPHPNLLPARGEKEECASLFDIVDRKKRARRKHGAANHVPALGS